jgi:hypothetical protein
VVGVLLALPAAAAGRVILDYYLDRHASGRLAADESVEVLAPDEPPATP